jgi:deazaflavin-dependent oxidoreductase (nitroreductase family)
MPVVVLTTTGRRTGKPRATPLTVIEHDGHTYVVASKGGDDRHPAWYLNLVDTPEVTLQREGRTEAMVARVLDAEEREAVWPEVVRTYQGYAGYKKRTDRQIPVVELVPAVPPTA